ncbi:MAG: PRC-barrel domain-containing protein [Burkholderiales bacterium]|nr:PRC-barrel domain-containing protein [Burkholderiales bacterium]
MKIKQKLSYLMILPAIALGAASAQAADADKRATAAQAVNAQARTSAPATAGAAQMRASDLIGTNVVNRQGEGLGEIKDLVVDTTSGKVQYAVVSFGGFLGLGDKLFAYPLERFERASERGKLALNVDKEKMKSAPGFDDKAWPKFDERYRAGVDRFHGTKSGAANVRYARASQILDGDVKDGSNNDIGDIEDMVVSLPDGKVSYVVLEFDRAWNPDDKLVAMPMKALKSEDGDGSDLVYTANKEQLKGAPSFEKNRWPDMADARFRADVGRYEQTWINNPAAWKEAPQAQRSGPVERAAERTADKVERAAERAGDKAERTVDRMSAPAKQQ